LIKSYKNQSLLLVLGDRFEKKAKTDKQISEAEKKKESSLLLFRTIF